MQGQQAAPAACFACVASAAAVLSQAVHGTFVSSSPVRRSSLECSCSPAHACVHTTPGAAEFTRCWAPLDLCALTLSHHDRLCVLQLMDRDPQMAQMLNNPELLRESLQLMTNPVSGLGPAACHVHALARQPTAWAALVCSQQQSLWALLNKHSRAWSLQDREGASRPSAGAVTCPHACCPVVFCPLPWPMLAEPDA